MLGRLLEISVSTNDPLVALDFYRTLGFRELSVGDVWPHAYAVVSDGDLCIGLHAYEFDSPALTFVQADLDHWVEAYRIQGIELAFEKLSPEQFNEIGFVDPGGQMVTVLETRTFSPAPFEDHAFTHLGRFAELELPCKDPDTSTRFWSRLGRTPEGGKLETAGVNVRLASAQTLVCHYRGDVLALAERVARQGLANITISADERRATVHAVGGPVFVVSQT